MGFGFSRFTGIGTDERRQIMEHWYNLIPLILVMAAGISILAFNDWRWMLSGLAASYLSAFLLLIQIISPGMAVSKLVTGIMATALIFVSRNEIPEEPQDLSPASRIFKITSLALIWLVVMLTAGSFRSIFPLNYETIAGALIAVTAGLLTLGTSKNAIKVTLGILVIYAGFEILYTPLESSVLINGLLSLITMLIALVGVYISRRHESEYEG